MTRGWSIEHLVGDAAEHHARQPNAERTVWWFEVERPALALGSAQRDEAVNREVAAALGIDVVRRRSGGGAVLVLPGEVVWLDVVIPAGDPLWDDDVSRSMVWVGQWWQGVLAGFGCATHVHRGPMVRTPWSADVCFSGVGSGEVLRGGAKLVGIAQRRTRSWARFQTMCHLRWNPELVSALVAAPRPGPAELAPSVATIGVEPATLTAALVAALPT